MDSENITSEIWSTSIDLFGLMKENCLKKLCPFCISNGKTCCSKKVTCESQGQLSYQGNHGASRESE